jgi:hypothetical protein
MWVYDFRPWLVCTTFRNFARHCFLLSEKYFRLKKQNVRQQTTLETKGESMYFQVQKTNQEEAGEDSIKVYFVIYIIIALLLDWLSQRY